MLAYWHTRRYVVWALPKAVEQAETRHDYCSTNGRNSSTQVSAARGGIVQACKLLCRVEPMVTHPAPPQTRTCAIHAYGSSGKAFCYPYSSAMGVW